MCHSLKRRPTAAPDAAGRARNFPADRRRPTTTPLHARVRRSSVSALSRDHPATAHAFGCISTTTLSRRRAGPAFAGHRQAPRIRTLRHPTAASRARRSADGRRHRECVTGTSIGRVESAISGFGSSSRLMLGLRHVKYPGSGDVRHRRRHDSTVSVSSFMRTCCASASAATGLGSNATTRPSRPVQRANCSTYTPTFAPTSRMVDPGSTRLARNAATSGS